MKFKSSIYYRAIAGWVSFVMAFTPIVPVEASQPKLRLNENLYFSQFFSQTPSDEMILSTMVPSLSLHIAEEKIRGRTVTRSDLREFVPTGVDHADLWDRAIDYVAPEESVFDETSVNIPLDIPHKDGETVLRNKVLVTPIANLDQLEPSRDVVSELRGDKYNYRIVHIGRFALVASGAENESWIERELPDMQDKVVATVQLGMTNDGFSHPEATKANAKGGLEARGRTDAEGMQHVGLKSFMMLPLYAMTTTSGPTGVEYPLEVGYNDEPNLEEVIDSEGNPLVLQVTSAEPGDRFNDPSHNVTYDIKVYRMYVSGTPVYYFYNKDVFDYLYDNPFQPDIHHRRQQRFVQEVVLADAAFQFMQLVGDNTKIDQEYVMKTPDVLNLQEAHIAPLARRIKIDRATHGKASAFAKTAVTGTNHTLVESGLEKFYPGELQADLGRINYLLGETESFDLGPYKRIASDGQVVIDFSRAFVDVAGEYGINGVSFEHADETKALYQRLYGEDIDVLGIPNGVSNIRRIAAIDRAERAGKPLSAEDLERIHWETKRVAIGEITRRTDVPLREDKPIVGAIRRIVEYKAQFDIFRFIIDIMVADTERVFTRESLRREWETFKTPWIDNYTPPSSEEIEGALDVLFKDRETINGLGMQVVVGGPEYKKDWVKRFKEWSGPGSHLHGRFVYAPDSDNKLLKTQATGFEVTVEMPLPLLEADGTSGKDARANGNIAVGNNPGTTNTVRKGELEHPGEGYGYPIDTTREESDEQMSAEEYRLKGPRLFLDAFQDISAKWYANGVPGNGQALSEEFRALKHRSYEGAWGRIEGSRAVDSATMTQDYARMYLGAIQKVEAGYEELPGEPVSSGKETLADEEISEDEGIEGLDYDLLNYYLDIVAGLKSVLEDFNETDDREDNEDADEESDVDQDVDEETEMNTSDYLVLIEDEIESYLDRTDDVDVYGLLDDVGELLNWRVWDEDMEPIEEQRQGEFYSLLAQFIEKVGFAESRGYGVLSSGAETVAVEPELAREVFEAFSRFESPVPIDFDNVTVRRIPSGNINETFILTDTMSERQFLVQNVNDVFDLDAVDRNLQNIERAQRASRINSRLPGYWRDVSYLSVGVENSDSKFYHENGNHWRVMNFIEGDIEIFDSFDEVPLEDRSDVARALGEAIATFQDMLIQTDVEWDLTLPGFHDHGGHLIYKNRIMAGDEVVLSLSADPDNTVKKLSDSELSSRYVDGLRRIEALNAKFDARRDLINSLDGLGDVIAHNDTKINNFIFWRDQEGILRCVCLIDLDTVQKGNILDDLGDALRSAANPAGESPESLDDVSIDVGVARDIIRGYLTRAERVHGLEKAQELRAKVYDAFRIYYYELGLRFFADALIGNQYFVPKPDQSADINLYRAEVQMRALEELEAIGEEVLLGGILESGTTETSEDVVSSGQEIDPAEATEILEYLNEAEGVIERVVENLNKSDVDDNWFNKGVSYGRTAIQQGSDGDAGTILSIDGLVQLVRSDVASGNDIGIRSQHLAEAGSLIGMIQHMRAILEVPRESLPQQEDIADKLSALAVESAVGQRSFARHGQDRASDIAKELYAILDKADKVLTRPLSYERANLFEPVLRALSDSRSINIINHAIEGDVEIVIEHVGGQTDGLVSLLGYREGNGGIVPLIIFNHSSNNLQSFNVDTGDFSSDLVSMTIPGAVIRADYYREQLSQVSFQIDRESFKVSIEVDPEGTIHRLDINSEDFSSTLVMSPDRWAADDYPVYKLNGNIQGIAFLPGEALHAEFQHNLRALYLFDGEQSYLVFQNGVIKRFEFPENHQILEVLSVSGTDLRHGDSLEISYRGIVGERGEEENLTHSITVSSGEEIELGNMPDDMLTPGEKYGIEIFFTNLVDEVVQRGANFTVTRDFLTSLLEYFLETNADPDRIQNFLSTDRGYTIGVTEAFARIEKRRSITGPHLFGLVQENDEVKAAIRGLVTIAWLGGDEALDLRSQPTREAITRAVQEAHYSIISSGAEPSEVVGAVPIERRVLAIEIGGTWIRGAIIDRDTGEVLAKINDKLIDFPYQDENLDQHFSPNAAEENQEDVLGQIKEHAYNLLTLGAITIDEVGSVSISTPGIVDEETGYMELQYNLPFTGTEFGGRAAQTIGISQDKLFVSNDMSASIHAELEYGKGKGVKHVVYVGVGTGTNASIKSKNGKLVNMEIGGIEIDGKNVEQFTSGGNLGVIAKERIENFYDGWDNFLDLIGKDDNDPITGKDVGEAYLKGDSFAAEIIENAARVLAFGIVDGLIDQRAKGEFEENVEVLLIFGGSVSEGIGQEKFVDLVQAKINELILPDNITARAELSDLDPSQRGLLGTAARVYKESQASSGAERTSRRKWIARTSIGVGGLALGVVGTRVIGPMLFDRPQPEPSFQQDRIIVISDPSRAIIEGDRLVISLNGILTDRLRGRTLDNHYAVAYYGTEGDGGVISYERSKNVWRLGLSGKNVGNSFQTPSAPWDEASAIYIAFYRDQVPGDGMYLDATPYGDTKFYTTKQAIDATARMTFNINSDGTLGEVSTDILAERVFDRYRLTDSGIEYRFPEFSGKWAVIYMSGTSQEGDQYFAKQTKIPIQIPDDGIFRLSENDRTHGGFSHVYIFNSRRVAEQAEADLVGKYQGSRVQRSAETKLDPGPAGRVDVHPMIIRKLPSFSNLGQWPTASSGAELVQALSNADLDEVAVEVFRQTSDQVWTESVRNPKGEIAFPGLDILATLFHAGKFNTRVQQPMIFTGGTEEERRTNTERVLSEALARYAAKDPYVSTEERNMEILSEGKPIENIRTVYYNKLYRALVKEQNFELDLLDEDAIKYLLRGNMIATNGLGRYLLIYIRATANNPDLATLSGETTDEARTKRDKAQALWDKVVKFVEESDDQIDKVGNDQWDADWQYIQDTITYRGGYQLEVGNPNHKPFDENYDREQLMEEVFERVKGGVFSVSGIRQIFDALVGDTQMPQNFPGRYGMSTTPTQAGLVHSAAQARLFAEMFHDPEAFAERIPQLAGMTPEKLATTKEKFVDFLTNPQTGTQSKKKPLFDADGRQLRKPKFVIMTDSKPTGAMLADVDIRMLLAMGIEVEYAYIGDVDKAAVFVNSRDDVDGAIYISASHNDEIYNGKKLLLGNGGVMPEEVAYPFIFLLRGDAPGVENRVTGALDDAAFVDELVSQVNSVSPEAVQAVYEGIYASEELANEAEWKYRSQVISGESDPEEAILVMKQKKARMEEQKYAIISITNGGARNDKTMQDLTGIHVHQILDRPFHDITCQLCPTTAAVKTLSSRIQAAYDELTGQGYQVLGAMVYDTDGDRRNMRITLPDGVNNPLDPDSRFGLKDDMAQVLFNFDVIGYVLENYDHEKKRPKKLMAVVANGPTSAAVEVLADILGFVVLRTQTGEANVVTGMNEIQDMTWEEIRAIDQSGQREIFVPKSVYDLFEGEDADIDTFNNETKANVVVSGEGSNGSDFTLDLVVRDPIHTWATIIKMGDPKTGKKFVRTMLARLGRENEFDESWWDEENRKYLLYNIMELLPVSITTDFFTAGGPGITINPPGLPLGLVKDQLDEVITDRFAEITDPVYAVIEKWAPALAAERKNNFINYEATAKIGKGNRTQEAPIGRQIGDGGYKLDFKLILGEGDEAWTIPLGWDWLRDSLTEAGNTRNGADVAIHPLAFKHLSRDEMRQMATEIYAALKPNLDAIIKTAVTSSMELILSTKPGDAIPDSLKPYERLLKDSRKTLTEWQAAQASTVSSGTEDDAPTLASKLSDFLGKPVSANQITDLNTARGLNNLILEIESASQVDAGLFSNELGSVDASIAQQLTRAVQASNQIKTIVGRDIVQFQRDRFNTNRAQNNAARFIRKVIHVSLADSQEDKWANDSELTSFLNRQFGVRKVVLAAGKASRLSPTELIHKSIADFSNNTSVKDVRSAAQFGNLDDVVVIDGTIAYKMLNEKSVGAQTKTRINDDLSDDFENMKSLEGFVDADTIDALRDEAIRLVNDEFDQAFHPNQIRDGAHLMREYARILQDSGIESIYFNYILDRFQYLIFRGLIETESPEEYIDPVKRNDVTGGRSILVLAPSNGPGGALLESARRLAELGIEKEAKYLTTVSSDFNTAFLDHEGESENYRNVFSTSYVEGVASDVAGVGAVPDVVLASRTPLNILPKLRGTVRYDESGRPNGVIEWRELTESQQLSALEGYGRTLKSNGFGADRLDEILKQPDPKNAAKDLLTDPEKDAVRRGYAEPLPVDNKSYYGENGNLFFFDAEWFLNAGDRYREEYNRPDVAKGKYAEWLHTGLVELAANDGKALVEVPFGIDAPKYEQKVVGHGVRYTEEIQAMLKWKLSNLGVEVDGDAVIAISSANADFNPDIDLPRIFSGQKTRISGRVHIDTSAKIVGNNVHLDGSFHDVVLSQNVSVQGNNLVVEGVVSENENIVVSQELTEIEPRAPPISGYVEIDSDQTSSLIADRVFIAPGARIFIEGTQVTGEELKEIFGTDVDGSRVNDQIYILGDVYLSKDARIENGTVIDGRRQVVLLPDNSYVGRGVSLDGVYLDSPRQFDGDPNLDVYIFQPPKLVGLREGAFTGYGPNAISSGAESEDDSALDELAAFVATARATDKGEVERRIATVLDQSADLENTSNRFDALDSRSGFYSTLTSLGVNFDDLLRDEMLKRLDEGTFEVPREAALASGAETIKAEEAQILIVDDDSSISGIEKMVFGVAIKGSPFNGRIADSQIRVESAYRAAHEAIHGDNIPDFAILDINLTGSNAEGFELARELRERNPDALIITIATPQGSDQAAIKDELLASGVIDQFIEKPTIVGPLKKAIEERFIPRLSSGAEGKETISSGSEIDAVKKAGVNKIDLAFKPTPDFSGLDQLRSDIGALPDSVFTSDASQRRASLFEHIDGIQSADTVSARWESADAYFREINEHVLIPNGFAAFIVNEFSPQGLNITAQTYDLRDGKGYVEWAEVDGVRIPVVYVDRLQGAYHITLGLTQPLGVFINVQAHGLTLIGAEKDLRKAANEARKSARKRDTAEMLPLKVWPHTQQNIAKGRVKLPLVDAAKLLVSETRKEEVRHLQMIRSSRARLIEMVVTGEEIPYQEAAEMIGVQPQWFHNHVQNRNTVSALDIISVWTIATERAQILERMYQVTEGQYNWAKHDLLNDASSFTPGRSTGNPSEMRILALWEAVNDMYHAFISIGRQIDSARVAQYIADRSQADMRQIIDRMWNETFDADIVPLINPVAVTTQDGINQVSRKVVAAKADWEGGRLSSGLEAEVVQALKAFSQTQDLSEGVIRSEENWQSFARIVIESAAALNRTPKDLIDSYISHDWGSFELGGVETPLDLIMYNFTHGHSGSVNAILGSTREVRAEIFAYQERQIPLVREVFQLVSKITDETGDETREVMSFIAGNVYLYIHIMDRTQLELIDRNIDKVLNYLQAFGTDGAIDAPQIISDEEGATSSGAETIPVVSTQRSFVELFADQSSLDYSHANQLISLSLKSGELINAIIELGASNPSVYTNIIDAIRDASDEWGFYNTLVILTRLYEIEGVTRIDGEPSRLLNHITPFLLTNAAYSILNQTDGDIDYRNTHDLVLGFETSTNLPYTTLTTKPLWEPYRHLLLRDFDSFRNYTSFVQLSHLDEGEQSQYIEVESERRAISLVNRLEAKAISLSDNQRIIFAVDSSLGQVGARSIIRSLNKIIENNPLLANKIVVITAQGDRLISDVESKVGSLREDKKEVVQVISVINHEILADAEAMSDTLESQELDVSITAVDQSQMDIEDRLLPYIPVVEILDIAVRRALGEAFSDIGSIPNLGDVSEYNGMLIITLLPEAIPYSPDETRDRYQAQMAVLIAA